jgi:phage baseplate assembly protein V
MMRGLLNVMRAQADMAGSGRAAVRLALVSSYDPVNYCAKARIQPEDTETGWLPVVSPWTGNGWGLFAPPTPGDLVEVQFQEDDIEAGFICQRFYNDTDRPLTVQSGEFWLVHQSGSFIKLTNDGKALINGFLEIDATAPTVNITATTGNVNVQAAGMAVVKAPAIHLQNAGSALKKLCTDVFMSLYNGHTHTSAGSGAQTAVPTQQASIGTHTTTVVTAE